MIRIKATGATYPSDIFRLRHMVPEAHAPKAQVQAPAESAPAAAVTKKLAQDPPSYADVPAEADTWVAYAKPADVHPALTDTTAYSEVRPLGCLRCAPWPAMPALMHRRCCFALRARGALLTCLRALSRLRTRTAGALRWRRRHAQREARRRPAELALPAAHVLLHSAVRRRKCRTSCLSLRALLCGWTHHARAAAASETACNPSARARRLRDQVRDACARVTQHRWRRCAVTTTAHARSSWHGAHCVPHDDPHGTGAVRMLHLPARWP
jgi:hypothetical protein